MRSTLWERERDVVLTNFQLIVLALISLTGAGWLSVKRTSAAVAPAVLAAIMLLLALGGPVWEWSKYSGGAGLPSTAKAAAFSESRAVSAFLWASIGAGLSAILVPPVPPQALPARKVMPSKKVGLAVAVISAVAFVAFVGGEGQGFLRKDVYLSTHGIVFLVHASWPLGILAGMIGTALIAWEEDRRLRLFLIGTSVIWFIGPMCVGSRSACAIPMIGGALIIYKQIQRRRFHLPLIAAALALFVTAFFTFGVVCKARELPHGLLNVPSLVWATTSDMANSTDSIFLPLKQLVASVFAGFPVTEEATRYNIASVLLHNANPLLGTGESTDLERYWPYSWVPLSFAGEWFGAMGWIGQILVFGALGWIFGLTMHNLQRSRFQLIAFLPLGFTALVGVLSVEYPSRMVWRVISLSVSILIASYLVRERSRHMVRGMRAKQPRNAIARNAVVNFEESAIHVFSALKVPNRVAMTTGPRYG
jgi:hypothetical protein